MSLLNPINKSLCLEQVCASNYEKLFRLIPDLCRFEDNAVGLAPKHSSLHLQILERTAYTLTIELSHCFSIKLVELYEPAIRIRIYLDARLAEALKDHERPAVSHAVKDIGRCRDILNYKWRLNFFLEKWLDHCLAKNYQFSKPKRPSKTLAEA
jgi:uncharacterized protein